MVSLVELRCPQKMMTFPHSATLLVASALVSHSRLVQLSWLRDSCVSRWRWKVYDEERLWWYALESGDEVGRVRTSLF